MNVMLIGTNIKRYVHVSAMVLDTRQKVGMSNTFNKAQIMSIARDLVMSGIKEGVATVTDSQTDRLADSLRYTFILPDINQYDTGFRAFLHKDLIETSTLVALEQASEFSIILSSHIHNIFIANIPLK